MIRWVEDFGDANRQIEKYGFDIDLKTGEVSIGFLGSSAYKKHDRSKDGQIARKLQHAFKSGDGASSLAELLRVFLENPNCGHFEIAKFKNPEDPRYPQLNQLSLSIQNYPPKPADELAPY